jgi:thiol:disulfide interchange protein DsbD
VLGVLAFPAGAISASALTGSIAPNSSPDLLEPTRAFQLSARRKDTKTIEIQYKIADGYYLYGSRFKFAVDVGSSIKLGKPKRSKGHMEHDPTFGRVETYRNSVRILLPITSMVKDGADTYPLRLIITSQGCADVGICYPPLRQVLTFAVGSAEAVMADRAADVGGSHINSQATPGALLQSFSDGRPKVSKP